MNLKYIIFLFLRVQPYKRLLLLNVMAFCLEKLK